jgi:ethanolamine utilization protein EutA
MSAQAGGRIFFSSAGRTLSVEDRISILTAGVDIGSSTSHLVFSRILLERLDSRYVVVERETLYESGILLTPYTPSKTGNEIDAAVLGAFIREQYLAAGVKPETIDTGALILTGVAAMRTNARAIGDLFAREAGKMVAVSAGDRLETIMAAHGSGAVGRSLRDRATVMNIDIGGGTSKLAICAEGKVIAQTALDVGARLISTGACGRIERIEAAGRLFAAELGFDLNPGDIPGSDRMRALAELMADRLNEAIHGGSPEAGGRTILRGDPLPRSTTVDSFTISGGVSEYFYGREKTDFGDLGIALANAVRKRLEANSSRILCPDRGIRATVVGASQYTTQVSGSTIYVSPLDILPLRNVPVIAPDLRLEEQVIDSTAVSSAIRAALVRLDLAASPVPVALFVPWRGPATWARLDAFCRGMLDGMTTLLARGHPLLVAGDGDVGGLIGVHFHEEMKLTHAVVSIDGLELREFDYIDIGSMLDLSGAVPVVIKSLIFNRNAGTAL